MATERQYKSAKRMGTGLPLVLDAELDTSLVALTDSSTGTAADTIVELADGSTYATDHQDIEDNFASLATKINEILTLLQNAGLRD